MKIMDVTIRDGGYCNNWQWPEDVFKNIVESLYGKVDIIEIGYRRPGKKGFEYCDDRYIDNLLGKKYNDLALMIDCKDYLCIGGDVYKYLLEHHFPVKSKKTPITYVRCACDIKHLEQSIEITKYLDSLGYKTTINIMKLSTLKSEDFKYIYDKRREMKHLMYLYFADSFGLSDIESLNRSGMDKAFYLGFHPHNNKNLAFSLYKSNEFDIIDSSIAGLGRGAGNLDTIQMLMDRNHKLYHSLYKCLKYIEKIKKESQCGYCYEYHYCAINNIHPNYGRYLKGLNRYGRYEIIKKLESIPEDKRSSFDRKVVE
jgi:4-hydroxy 2-oxovalerate aldolase